MRDVGRRIAEQHRAPAARRGLQRRDHCRRNAGRFDAHLDAVAVRVRRHDLLRIGVAAVEGEFKTKLPRERQFFRNQIEQQNLRRSHFADPLRRHQANRSRAENGDRIAEPHVRAPRGVQRDGRGFGHGRFFERDVVGNSQQIFDRRDDVFREAAVAARTEVIVIDALHVLARFTRGAPAAPQQRKHGHAIAGRKTACFIAERFDHAGKFMAANRGEVVRPLRKATRNIRTADAAEADAHQRFAGARLRARHRFVPQVVDGVQDERVHGSARGDIFYGRHG